MLAKRSGDRRAGQERAATGARDGPGDIPAVWCSLFRARWPGDGGAPRLGGAAILRILYLRVGARARAGNS